MAIIAEEFKRAGWSEPDLSEGRKGDPRKVKIALRLWKETTMTLSWIAQRLHSNGGESLEIEWIDEKILIARN